MILSKSGLDVKVVSNVDLIFNGTSVQVDYSFFLQETQPVYKIYGFFIDGEDWTEYLSKKAKKEMKKLAIEAIVEEQEQEPY